jgi:hypothetical protein
MRNISDEEIETFWRDGVVCLRSAVSRARVEPFADEAFTTRVTVRP